MSMGNSEHEKFKSYRREFKKLRADGCILCYPESSEVKPKKLAEMMAYDTAATYMRDVCRDDKGGLVRITFSRIEL
ncbi:MAG: hypothetical protein LKM35_05290 [Lachnospiraceae bacterium]|jgi:hypothetical protein|nr:hypothetical protein [Lachnospiraceae bacterium]MCI1727086.1 hypothetical protein [Lachnospiraceae bacterium]